VRASAQLLMTDLFYPLSAENSTALGNSPLTLAVRATRAFGEYWRHGFLYPGLRPLERGPVITPAILASSSNKASWTSSSLSSARA